MLKIAHLNATETGMWKWFDLPSFKGVRVELRLLTRTDLAELRLLDDLRSEATVVANKFFRDFSGCVDANGVAIPNTVENRAEMLEDSIFGTFVTSKLADIAAWRDEGKDGSGSAS
jgi:hypothetical protein